MDRILLLIAWMATPSTSVVVKSDSVIAPPERLVAEAVISSIHTKRGAAVDSEWIYPFLQVVLHGHTASVVLDLGTDYGLVLWRPALAPFGGSITDGPLDSLSIGTAVEHNVDVNIFDQNPFTLSPEIPPMIGVMGGGVLSHYDLLFDGPARRVRVYAPDPHKPAAPDSAATANHRAAWLPPGLTPADCVAMKGLGPAHLLPGVDLQADGHPMLSMFDSGSPFTNMNVTAGHALNLTQHSPNVHLLSSGDGQYRGASGKNYVATGVHLTIGNVHLTDGTIRIVPRIPMPAPPDTPVLNLGLDAVRDRIFFVSFSTKRICVGAPHVGR